MHAPPAAWVSIIARQYNTDKRDYKTNKSPGINILETRVAEEIGT